MENILSRSRHRKEVYIRPSLERKPSEESINSLATASNLPGPGRVVGLVYDAAGRRVERFMNNRAGQLGLGPKALLQDIRSRRPVSNGRWGYPWNRPAPTDEERVKLEDKCRSLLSYCKSHLLETQLEALDAVTTLAIEDSFVRQVLGDILHRHQSYLVPKYREKELYIASSKALISIKEKEIYDFCLRFTNECARLERREISVDDPELVSLKDQLAMFFKDPDISFLLGRILLVNYGLDYGMQDFVFSTYFDIATSKPRLIEWETLREAFATGCLSTSAYGLERDGIMGLAQHFPVLQLYQTRWTSFRDAQRPIDESELADLEALFKESHYVVYFLNSLCGTTKLIDQLRFLRNADEKTQKLFEGTVFGNEILIAWAHIHHQNVCELCPVQVMPDETGVAVMLSFYFRGDENQRDFSRTVITVALETSRYFKNKLITMMSRFLENTDMHMVEPPPLSRRFRKLKSLPLDDPRVCVTSRALIKKSDVSPGDATMEMYLDDALYCQIDLWTWLEVNGEERPFDVTGHFPILAGYDTSGKELYVGNVNYHRIYVSEGTRDVTYHNNSGEVQTSSRFKVMVLSHDPCDVGLDSDEIPEDAKLQTGPAFWRRETGKASITEIVGGTTGVQYEASYVRRAISDSEEITEQAENTTAQVQIESEGDELILDVLRDRFTIRDTDGWEEGPSRSNQDDGYATEARVQGISVQTDAITERVGLLSSSISRVEFEVDLVQADALTVTEGQSKETTGVPDTSTVIERIRQFVEKELRQLGEEKQFLEHRLHQVEERVRELQMLETIGSDGGAGA